MRELGMRAALVVVGSLGLWTAVACSGPLNNDSITVAPGGPTTGPLQRSPSGGVGEVSNGSGGSAGQAHVDTTPGGAQVLDAPNDPHSPEILRTRAPKLNVLEREQKDLVDGAGVPTVDH